MSSKVKLAAQLDDFDKRSDETGLGNFEPTRTKQSFKDETDINVLVKRFGVTTTAQMRGLKVPSYGDFGEKVFDFQSAMNAVVDAQRAFDTLPADVRKRFGHDPQEFIAFFNDPANVEEGRKLGLVLPERVIEEAAPIKVSVVDAAPQGEPQARPEGGEKKGGKPPKHSSST